MTWNKIEATGIIPDGRLSPLVVHYQNYLILFGGYTGKERLSDLHRFDLSTKCWAPIVARGEIPNGFRFWDQKWC